VIIYSWANVNAPGDRPSYHLVFDSVYFIEPVSVGNAKWEIGLSIRNDGDNEVLLKKVYVSEKLIEEYGLAPGDSLSSPSTIGCSIPSEGLIIKRGKSETLSIWIGSGLYSSGNTISVHIIDPKILEYARYIKLR